MTASGEGFVRRYCNKPLPCVVCHELIPPDHECLMMFGDDDLLVVCCPSCEGRYRKQRQAA